MFFGADAGPATISVAVTPPFGKVPNNRANLKAAVALYNEQGVLLQSLQPGALAMSAPAANVQLPSKGIYYVAVSGAGEGIPKAEGYSSYGSLGWYTVSVSYQASAVECVGSWGAWGPCSASCTQTAEYKVTRPAGNGGAACPVADGAQQTQACSGGSCRPPAQNCIGSWGDWSSCSAGCTQTQTYQIQQPGANGGAACPVADGSVQSRPCSGGGCVPANCVGAWGDWSSCSAACSQTQTYRIQQQAANGGSACLTTDGAVQTRPCSGGSCKPPAQNCVGHWSDWSSCSAACTQTSTFRVWQAAANGGAACPAADGAAQTQACSGGDCRPPPQDCAGDWTALSGCSAACMQTTIYRLWRPAVNGGSACSAADGDVRTVSCSGGDCRPAQRIVPPQDCVGSWNAWSSCSAACTQTTTYTVTQPAANGGTACATADGAAQTQPCSGGECRPKAQDCVGSWSAWSACNAACKQTTAFKITQQAANGGAACPVVDGFVQTQQCSGGDCRPPPQNCLGTWSDWSICSASCTQATTYKVQQSAANGGSPCPDADGAVQMRPCSGGNCIPQNCIGAWNDWSSCSTACTQTQTYKVQQPGANGGSPCPVTDGAVQTRPCSGGSCNPPSPQNCIGAWGDWSTCRSSCTQTMVYSVQQPAANGGAACPATHGASQWRPCSGGSCIALITTRDCIGSWSDWSACGAACTQTATYSVQLPAANGGAACPAAHGAVQTSPCSGGSCSQTAPAALPVNCIGSWGDWGACSSSCTQAATFSVTQNAASGGAACSAADGAVRSRPCSGGDCRAQDCLGGWEPWSSCSAACTQIATYVVTQAAANGRGVSRRARDSYDAALQRRRLQQITRRCALRRCLERLEQL